MRKKVVSVDLVVVVHYILLTTDQNQVRLITGKRMIAKGTGVAGFDIFGCDSLPDHWFIVHAAG